MSAYKWPLINNNISKDDKKALSNFILTTDRFTNGPKVREFEEEWSKWLGVEYSVMVNSGASANYITAAITRELKGQTGEIIVPPIGWVSDISSVINTGFVPVFVDASVDNLAITYENIKNAINEKTKAIVMVHCLGFNGLSEKIVKLAKEHNLILIEDCCESHGAYFEDKKVGSIGDMSCFSFYFGHHITTIEGGMISTNNFEIYQLARLFRSHGMTREVSGEMQDKYHDPSLNPLFTFGVAGYNMRSTEINAVLGLQQIKRLDYNIDCRKNNLKVWLEELDGEKYNTDFVTKGNSSFALPLVLKDENKDLLKNICDILETEGVEYRLGTAGGGNQARQPYLKNYKFKISGTLDVANFIHENSLYVGNHTDLTKDDIVNLCGKLNLAKE
jgi:CDP-6-deoxy-D-xylo-4-hexulose-3-dehydrase